MLSEAVTAEAVLDDLPPYLGDELLTRRIYEAGANELDRARTTLLGIRGGLQPLTATDTYNGLSMLEAQMGLPVAPAGETEDARREKLLAYLQARRAGTGAAWVRLLSLALGSTPWSYREGPADFTVVIRFPYAAGTFTAGRVLALARAITPAHIDIIASYSEGFLIGISLIGVEAL